MASANYRLTSSRNSPVQCRCRLIPGLPAFIGELDMLLTRIPDERSLEALIAAEQRGTLERKQSREQKHAAAREREQSRREKDLLRWR